MRSTAVCAAVTAGLIVAAGVAPAQEAEILDHTVAPIVLGGSPVITVPLDFAGRVEYDVLDRLRLSDEAGRLLDASGPIRLVSANPRFDDAATGRWVAELEVADSLRTPVRLVINVYPPDGQTAHTRLLVPLVAPQPALGNVEFAPTAAPEAAESTVPSGFWTETLRVVPGEPVHVQFRLRGGPFFEGAELRLEGNDVVVDAVRPNRITGTISLEPTPARELPIGPIPLILRDSVSGWSVERTVMVEGNAPRFVSVPAVQATGGYQALVVEVRDVVPGARFRIQSATDAYRVPEQVLLPEIESNRVSLQVPVPELPSGVNGAEFRLVVINPDEQTATALVRVDRPRLQTMRAEPVAVTVGVPTRVEFVVLSGNPRFEPAKLDDYAVRVGAVGEAAELLGPRVAMQGERLVGRLLVAEQALEGGATTGPVGVTIVGPGGQRWRGELRLDARPRIDGPDPLRLRPGEIRAVRIEGAHLVDARIVGGGDVAVLEQSLSDRGGVVRLAAASTATGESRLALVRGALEVDGLTVEIRPWTRPETLAGIVEWRTSSESEWQPWNPGAERAIAVEPDAEIAFRARGTEQVPWAEETIRFRVQRPNGLVLWRDSIPARPGDTTRTRSFFRPGAALDQGDAFIVRAEGPGGQFHDQVFRVRYDRPLMAVDRLALLPSLSAVQWTPGSEEFDAGLFNGVALGLTYGIDAIDNALGRSGVLEPVAVLFVSKPQASTDGDATAADEPPAQLHFGGGIGFALLRQVLFAVGYDRAGDSGGRLFLNLGATFDLGGIGGLGWP